MKNNIIYDRKNKSIECIYYKDSTQSYPTHTHASHITFGLVSDGAVCVVCDGGRKIYRAGASFCIFPDTPHAIETVNGATYSMCLQLRFVDVIPNTFTRCNADEMIAELPGGIFGGEGRVLRPGDVCKFCCRFRQSERTVVKCFK